MVDISVDVSTEYRSIVGQVAGERRSSIGCYIGDVSTDHWITFGREIDQQSVAIASAVCRQYIGKVSVDASADTRSTQKGTRILLCSKPVKPGHYGVLRWHIFARSLDLIW